MNKPLGFLMVLSAIAVPCASQNLLQNGTFDTGITPWSAGTFSTLDSLALADSGSIQIVSTNPAFTLASSVSECIPVTGGKIYEGSYDYRLVATAGISGLVQVFPSWYSSSVCSGFLGFSSTVQGSEVDGAWHTISALGPTITAPASAQSMRLNLTTAKLQNTGSITANFDDVVFKAAGTCAPGPDVLCLNNGRFQVEANWETASSSGRARVVKLTNDTGYLWFFGSDNVETVVKVLDACSFNNTFWVFAGGLTDQGVEMTITDTKNGTSKVYRNTRGAAFAPVQDTSAFATCP
ncbi:MAG TPA: hypothetical protein VNA69_01630 [Thermoanaerobaculia bacterium]|nr:hypothetical protein [Thermoanaerobaculia bacterium]